jgi:hypothetical protein
MGDSATIDGAEWWCREKTMRALTLPVEFECDADDDDDDDELVEYDVGDRFDWHADDWPGKVPARYDVGRVVSASIQVACVRVGGGVRACVSEVACVRACRRWHWLYHLMGGALEVVGDCVVLGGVQWRRRWRRLCGVVRGVCCGGLC